ncbi:MAG: hypothetical protein ACPHP0_06415, partial [Flavobacteriaceae bacterium]
MKQLILLTLTFCYSINSFSQVGIGTAEPNASSQLEVKADDKGVLLPQVALQSTTDNNTISNGNVVSLLVYNTNNSDDLKAIEEETTSTKTDLAMLLNPIYFDLNKSFIREDAK